MTAWDDAITKAHEVLALEATVNYECSFTSDVRLERLRSDLASAAPDLARALKAVQEAMEEAEAVSSSGQYGRAVRFIRAAILRRLSK